MILDLDDCERTLRLYDDTAELSAWIDDVLGDGGFGPAIDYYLREIQQNLDGLYALARSQHHHLFAPLP